MTIDCYGLHNESYSFEPQSSDTKTNKKRLLIIYRLIFEYFLVKKQKLKLSNKFMKSIIKTIQ